jgi:uncharacterized OB-fold protein
MSRLAPAVTDETAAFWDATRQRVLVLPWCSTCGRVHWFPRAVCPGCLGPELEWRPSTGDGTVHAVSVHHRPGMGRTADDCPYAVALVDLPEGVRILAEVVDCEPDDIAVGDPVRLAWRPLDDGRNLIAFTPQER